MPFFGEKPAKLFLKKWMSFLCESSLGHQGMIDLAYKIQAIETGAESVFLGLLRHFFIFQKIETGSRT